MNVASGGILLGLMIGVKLSGRYEILRELGRGGMGVVNLARDPVLDREVAVKVVSPEHVSAESIERFKREARLVAKLDHPAIVGVYDSGEHEGALFFVMPLVDGTNLRSVLKKETLRLGDLIDIAIQTAEALEYSHSQGIIHRDIKPENIMVSFQGSEIRARITDFGLAVASSQDRLTKTAMIVGTVAYMSPEQVTGKGVDASSDIYSFGTVLYECLVGQTPFSGEVQALVYRISHEIPVPPRSMQAELDEEVEEIILRCLEKEPSKRPGGQEIVEVLSRTRAKLQSDGRNLTMLPTASALHFQFQRPAMRPFVGRDREFADLQKRLNASIGGECQLVLIAGEAGIGKSRLLEELESLAKVRLIPVYHGRFVEMKHSLPYQGYCEAIQEYFRSRTGSGELADFSDLASDLISLFPVLAEIKELAASSEETLKPVQDTGTRKFEDRTYIYELLARAITRIAAGKPLILFLEDLHAADVSVDALDYIAHRLAPTPTLLVGTYRTSDVDKRHPVMNLLSGFKGDRRFQLISLGPLSPSDHRLYLQKLIGGSDLEENLVQKFYQATEGNPYFTSELVRSLLDSGGIVREESGFCRLSGETALSIEELPVTIQQTVEERIERLPKREREILSLASLLGRTFDYAHLEVLAEGTEDLDDVVEQLLRDGFLEEDRQSRSDRISFSSGVVRDVLYASLPRRKRRGLHRKHAEELEARNTGRLERVYAELFDHFTQADEEEKVVEYGFLLAKKSLDTLSPDDAIRVLQTVIDFLEESGSQLKVGEARTQLAEAYQMTGNVVSALEELEAAIGIFEGEKAKEQVLACSLSAAEIAWQGRKVEETKHWVDKGIDLAGTLGDTAGLTKFLSLGATVANLRGDYATAQRYIEEVERLKPAKEEIKKESAQGGSLLVAHTNACQAKHPAEAVFNEEVEILSNVFEPLVKTDPRGNLVPHLCERWETLSEGSVFLFVLRKDVRLHDGRRLTAGDIKTSFEQAIRRTATSLLSAFAAIRGVDEYLKGKSKDVGGLIALSENIIQILLQNPLPIYPTLLTDSRTGIAVEASTQTSEGSSFLGTGPFRIASFRQDSIVLEKNPDYWKGSPAMLDSLRFTSSLTSAEVGKGFLAGKYDVVRDLLPQDLEEILRDRSLRVTLAEAPRRNVYFVLFNEKSEACRLAEVRKALAGGVPIYDLVRSSLGRFALPAEGLLPPGILGHDPGRRRHPLNKEKATELIRSSGLPTPIHLQASVHPLMQDRYSSLTQALFRVWAEIGVEISIRTLDLDSYNQSWERNEGIDLLIGRWNGDYDDPDAFTYGLFQSVIGELRNYLSSKEMDEQIEEARSAGEPLEREKLYKQFDTLLVESGSFLPLFHEIDYRLASPKVRGLMLSSVPPYVNYPEISRVEEEAAPSALKTDRGVIRVPIPIDFSSMNPSNILFHWEGLVIASAFETLTYSVEGARIIPWLASRFEVEKGGKRFRFFLRDNVRFHDGRKLTARDVRYSFEHLLQNQRSQNRWFLSSIQGADKFIQGRSQELEGFRIVSALEFVIDLEQPLSFFPALLAYAATAIIPEGSRNFQSSWREGCVGTGAFRIGSFNPGRSLKLEANPGYWRPGYPKSDGIEFEFQVPPEEILAGFKSGRFTLAWDLLPGDAEALRHESEYAAKYKEIPLLSTYYLAFNTQQAPFSDKSLRLGIVQALSRSGVIRRNLGRLELSAHSLVPPGLLGYESRVNETKEAIQVKWPQETVDINLEMHPTFESKFSTLTREILNLFADKGFRIHVVKEGDPKAVERSSVHLKLTRWAVDYPDTDSFMNSLLHSERGVEGPHFFRSEEIDRLIEKGRTESDPSVRHSVYRQIEDIIRERAMMLPLFHDQFYCFVGRKTEGLELNFFSPFVFLEKLRTRR